MQNVVLALLRLSVISSLVFIVFFVFGWIFGD
jgi:hypothetical protein